MMKKPLTNDDELLSVQTRNQEDQIILQEFDNDRLVRVENLSTGEETIYSYDDIHQEVMITFGSSEQIFKYGPDGDALTEDDQIKSVKFMTDEGELILQEFNASGRIVRVENLMSGEETTYLYNDNDQSYEVKSSGFRQLISYGADGEPLTDDDVVLSVDTDTGEGETITQIFDGDGRLIQTINETTGVVTDYEYDDMNEIYTVIVGDLRQSFGYGADGEPLTDDDELNSVRFPNEDGEVMVQEFEGGRVVRVVNETSGEESIYSYDDQVEEITITVGSTEQVFGYGPDHEALTDDDQIKRVTFTTDEGELMVQKFNASGRIIEVENLSSGEVTTYLYNDNDQNYEVKGTGFRQLISYGADGEPLTDDDVVLSVETTTEEGDEIIQTLDDDGRVVRVENVTQGTVTEYSYDDVEEEYVVSVGDTVQVFGYGADHEALNPVPFTS